MAAIDQWKISGDDREKHDSQFFKLKPVNGFITGEQARGFFMQSGLPTQVLGHIWGLADMNSDGKMDKKEFSIAMHLIKKKLQGYEVPKVLPASMKADPSPSVGIISSSPMHIGSAGFSASQTSGGFMDSKPRADSFGRLAATNAMTAPVAKVACDWSMPHPSRLKFMQMFNVNDHNKRGYLTGVEARALLMQCGLPHNVLAQVWNLADVDKDGNLTSEEFVIAMFLIEQSRAGHQLPALLPPELTPANIRSSSMSGQAAGFLPPPPSSQIASFQPAQQPQPVKKAEAFGDLLGNLGPSHVMQATSGSGDIKPEETSIFAATFEDKRKQNFDKGQAELEKRRQALQDQLRKEEEARLDKERKEHEKREQLRLERERKKQHELDKQMEKQRELEKQREDQRQKMLEQREAARRELERQRQMEWERQRKEQLMVEKMREGEQLAQIKSQNTNLKNELDSMDAKKIEITQKITQVRSSATEITGSIEQMRQSRDNKMADIERFQHLLQELSEKYVKCQKDREQLATKVQMVMHNNPLYDMHRTASNSLQTKRSSIEKLKQELAAIEKATASKLAEIDTSNSALKELNQKAVTAAQPPKLSKQTNITRLVDTRPSSVPLTNGEKVSWFDSNNISSPTRTSNDSLGFNIASSSVVSAVQPSNWASELESRNGDSKKKKVPTATLR